MSRVDPRLLVEAVRLRIELEEIERALELLRRGDQRRFYISLPGGSMLEVSREEAEELLEKRRIQLLALLRNVKGSKSE